MNPVTDYLEENEKIIFETKPRLLPYLLKRILFLNPIGIFISVIIFGFIGFFNYVVASSKAYIAFALIIPIDILFILFYFWEPLLVITQLGLPKYYMTSKKRVIILKALGGLRSPFLPYVAIFSKNSTRNMTITQSFYERLFNLRSLTFNLAFESSNKHYNKEEFKSIYNKETDKSSFGIKTVSGSIESDTIALSPYTTLECIENPEEIIGLFKEEKAIQKKEQALTTTKPSFVCLLSYAVICDFINTLHKVLAISIFFASTFVMFSIFKNFAGLPPNFEVALSYYLPKAITMILFVFLIIIFYSSTLLRVLIKWISPSYKVTQTLLEIRSRELKLFTDPPHTCIELSKIKHIWKVWNPVDSFFGNKTATYLLGVELEKTELVGLPKGIKKYHKDNLMSKILKNYSGSLSYCILLSIPKETLEENVESLEKPTFFEKFIYIKILFG